MPFEIPLGQGGGPRHDLGRDEIRQFAGEDVDGGGIGLHGRGFGVFPMTDRLDQTFEISPDGGVRLAHSRGGSVGPVEQPQKRNPYASGPRTEVENPRWPPQSPHEARADLDQRLAGWPRNEGRWVDLDAQAVEPGLADQILDRLVVSSAADPVPERLAFLVGGDAFWFHIKTQTLRPDRCGDEHLRRDARGIDVPRLQVGLYPPEQPAGGPGL